MRKVILVVLGGALIVATTFTWVRAQSRRASPHESVSGMVDGAGITIRYGRPSKRGRHIFGGLVPYGRVWCPGADEATTLESAKDLLIGDLKVPAGPHTIWILPTADAWTLIVSNEPDGFHTAYHPSEDMGRVPFVKGDATMPVEQLTFRIEQNAGAKGGVITMAWDTTEASVGVTVR